MEARRSWEVAKSQLLGTQRKYFYQGKAQSVIHRPFRTRITTTKTSPVSLALLVIVTLISQSPSLSLSSSIDAAHEGASVSAASQLFISMSADDKCWEYEGDGLSGNQYNRLSMRTLQVVLFYNGTSSSSPEVRLSLSGG